METLRSTMGSSYLITAAVPEFGWSFSASPFAAYFDYIVIMTYDMYASPWAGTTGPNAPLAQCNSRSDSIKGSVALWQAAGFSACQLLLGIPGYGHQFTTTSSQLATTTFNGQNTLMFQPYNNQIADQAPEFKALISNGWLSTDGTTGAGGFTRYWDACTSTPFLFNPSTRVFVSYDDAQSTKIKAQYAAANGLAGVSIYSSIGPTVAVFDAAKEGLTGQSVTLAPSSSGTCGVRLLREHRRLLFYRLPVSLWHMVDIVGDRKPELNRAIQYSRCQLLICFSFEQALEQRPRDVLEARYNIIEIGGLDIEDLLRREVFYNTSKDVDYCHFSEELHPVSHIVKAPTLQLDDPLVRR
ncbi:hypothetical protein RQP46_000291 [Phenoliferia psychrophenolica]